VEFKKRWPFFTALIMLHSSDKFGTRVALKWEMHLWQHVSFLTDVMVCAICSLIDCIIIKQGIASGFFFDYNFH
jgi:hypothetical protein